MHYNNIINNIMLSGQSRVAGQELRGKACLPSGLSRGKLKVLSILSMTMLTMRSAWQTSP